MLELQLSHPVYVVLRTSGLPAHWVSAVQEEPQPELFPAGIRGREQRGGSASVRHGGAPETSAGSASTHVLTLQSNS